MKHLVLMTAMAACLASCGQIVITNLGDRLGTEITIDRNMDIDSLNASSIKVDEDARMNSGVRDMSVRTEVIMTRPLVSRVDGKYEEDPVMVLARKMKTPEGHFWLLNKTNTANIMIGELNSSMLVLTNRAIVNVGTITLDGMTVGNLTLDGISLDNIAPNMIVLDGIAMKELSVDGLDIQKLMVQKYGVPRFSVDESVFVVDCGDAYISTNAYNVAVTEETYIELAEMRLISRFEYGFSSSFKEKVKLLDMNKLDRSLYVKWIETLSDNRYLYMETKRSDRTRNIIGEAWIYRNRYDSSEKENMLRNLDFLRRNGYDTVLVRFDCTEDIYLLKKMIQDIKDVGFEVFSTYVGIDGQTPRWNPFIDPDVIEKYVAEVAPMSRGYFLNWRDTSNHVRILPSEYFNWLCKTLRKHNPEILIYGEIYYGQIGPLRNRALMYTVPQGVTGAVIMNSGFYGYNISGIVNNLFSKEVPGYLELDKIGQVIGIAPYYSSRAENKIEGLTTEKEYKYKKKVENQFRRVMCGCVTMIHDGVDDYRTSLVGKPGDPKTTDSTDNIVYDRKLNGSK